MASKNIEAIYRLSPLQEGILYHCLEAPNSDRYFQQFSCIIEGLNDLDRWQQCWQSVTQRHPAMRTLFTWDKRDQPLQIVRERISLNWHVLDWQEISVEQQTLNWQSLLRRDRDLNFDLSIAPLVRFTLAKTSSNSYFFLFSFHHILLDGWSQRLLLDEAIGHYQTDLDSFLILPPPPSYASFIDWLYAQDKMAAEAFWSKQLSGFKQPTSIGQYLVPDSWHKKPDSAEVCELALNQDVAEKLKLSARQHRLTLNTLVLGAWSVILANACRTTDVVFGTTVAGRPHSLLGVEKIAGLFINTLPFRAHIEYDAALENWLRSLQSKQAECREFEQTALADIQRWSDVPAGTALFESIIVFENLPVLEVPHANSKLTVSNPQYNEFSHYPLAILVDPSKGLNLIAVHQLNHFSSKKAQALLAQLQVVLVQMSHSLDIAVSELSVLSDKERQLTVDQWNQTQRPVSKPLCIHQYFENWAQHAADKIAVVYASASSAEQQEISYGDLNKRANQLARYLIAKGLGKESIVPVLVERSIETIIVFLAVLKAGGAYIPLDSSFPKERISAIFGDLGEHQSLMVTQQSFADSLPDFNGLVVFIDIEGEQIANYAGNNLDVEIIGSQLAYVIYTSGSSGKPKGVMIEHMALVNSTLARLEFYPQQPSMFLMLSSFASDSSVAGVFWSLCSGQSLLLANTHIEQDMRALEQVIATNQVTHLLCIPSLYFLILEHCETRLLHSLNTVIVAGESCQPAVIRAHQRKLMSPRQSTGLFNEYGPSECTVWATVSCLTDWHEGQSVPIGRAIANTQLFVLDSYQKPVPIGVVGELHIGGMGLARGYLNQIDKTDERFIDVRIAIDSKKNPVVRLYRTGDLVRYQADGELEFVGRSDNQIKVRGYRVEPEEIENILAAHPGVQEVVVFVDLERTLDSGVEYLSAQLAKLEPSRANLLLDQIEEISDEQAGEMLQ